MHALCSAIEVRDPYTGHHQNGVSVIARQIGQIMQLSSGQIECLRVCGTLHDIGKIGIPAEILTKPGRLTSHEYELVKQHSLIGAKILEGVQFPWPVRDIVSQHHERLDGTGYPYGLQGSDILLEAKIIAVADVFEAIMIDRPYRKGLGLDAALDEIQNNSGKLYDSNVVDACTDLMTKQRNRFAIYKRGQSELPVIQQILQA